jgi:hypothetical protein
MKIDINIEKYVTDIGHDILKKKHNVTTTSSNICNIIKLVIH